MDSGHVYWTNGALIGRANLDGSGVDGSFIVGLTNANGIAVTATHIYWTELGASPAIDEANLDGSSVRSIPVPGLGEPFAVAVDGTYLYWADVGNDAIGRAPLANPSASDPTFITGLTGSPKGVAVDATHIYWSDDAGTIGRANLDGTGSNDSFITGAQSPQGLAVDATNVYWANSTSNTIGRAPLANPAQASQTFIAGASAPFAVAVDSGAAPVSTQAPTVTGLPVSGAALTEQHGSWTGSPTTFAVQWLSCDASGAHCAPIAAATAASYDIQPSDIGSTIRAQEGARNTFGSSFAADSAPSAVIQPPGPFLVGTIRTSGPTATLQIDCHGPATCLGQAILTVREHKRGGRVIAVTARPRPLKIVSVTIGHSSFAIPVGHISTVKITLNGVGRGLLSGFYTLNVDATFPSTAIPDRTLTFNYPLINAPVHFEALLTSAATTFTSFSVSGLVPAATVRLTCRGGGCPFIRRQRIARRRSVSLEGWLAGAHLAPGATLQLTVTAPNHIGSVTILRMRSRRPPIESDLCLPPASRAPQRCR